MYVRLREARQLSRREYRLTLDVVDPERHPWDQGDCVVRVDLTDEPTHHAVPRGLLKPAFEVYALAPTERPVDSDSRLLWDIGRAVRGYVDRVFAAGLVCPFNGPPLETPSGRPDGSPP